MVGMRLALPGCMPHLLDPSRDGLDLGELWHALRAGTVFVTETNCRNGRCFATLSDHAEGREGPRDGDLQALERVLAGELNKVVASELHISPSTLSLHCSKALRAIATQSLVSRVPIVLVTAALCARGWLLPRARIEGGVERGLVISFELPGKRLMARLTGVEAEVLRMTVEGKSHAEIASGRGTSRRTVANQLGAIFRKLGVSGRSALRALAVEEESRAWSAQASELALP
jgi:DNA-binding CsgD family transcriptional regulator